MSDTARRGATIFIFVTVLIDMLTFGMIGPVLPKLIAGFVGNDYAHAAEIIGIFATAWALMQFFCSPLLGMLSNRVGRRPVILLSNAVTAVDYAIMALAPWLVVAFCGRRALGHRDREHDRRQRLYRRRDAAGETAPCIQDESRRRVMAWASCSARRSGGLVGTINPAVHILGCGRLYALLNALYGLFVLPESLPRERRTPQLGWRRANPAPSSLKLLRCHQETLGTLVGELRINVRRPRSFPKTSG